MTKRSVRVMARLLLSLALTSCGGGGGGDTPPGGAVTTIAGLARQYGSADGAGADARFFQPGGVAVDATGAVFVADTYNSTIRKVTPDGSGYTVSTVAGLALSTGTANGVGSNARFDHPEGLALDGAGNLYVVDTNNGSVRKLTWNGSAYAVTTIATALHYPRGVAVDGSGNVYVTDTNDATVRKLTWDGATYTGSVIAGATGVEGSADGDGLTLARFTYPTGITIDAAGNLYLLDSNRQTLRKLTKGASAYTVGTIAGLAGQGGSADGAGAAARFGTPRGLTVDAAGDVLFVADTNNSIIRKVTRAGAGYSVTTLTGQVNNSDPLDGTLAQARFAGPTSIARDASGDLYVADLTGHTVRKITF